MSTFPGSLGKETLPADGDGVVVLESNVEWYAQVLLNGRYTKTKNMLIKCHPRS